MHWNRWVLIACMRDPCPPQNKTGKISSDEFAKLPFFKRVALNWADKVVFRSKCARRRRHRRLLLLLLLLLQRCSPRAVVALLVAQAMLLVSSTRTVMRW